MSTKESDVRILDVDLTNWRTDTVTLPTTTLRRYLGGGGLALYLLLSEAVKTGRVPEPGDGLNPSVVATGTLNGSTIPGTNRFTVSSRSPLTGMFGEAEAGGSFGPALKRAGYDAILLRGASDRPCYLLIKEGRATIKDGSRLWGLFVADAEERIRGDVGEKVRIACIGPAGEREVSFACILTDSRHACGRTGMGAVWGSKKLKAIAVADDNKFIPRDKELVREIARRIAKGFNPEASSLTQFGTAGSIPYYQANGMLPSFGFRRAQFEQWEAISGQALKQKFLKSNHGCSGCFVRCKRIVEHNGKPTVDPRYGGPEYETIGALGPMCGISDLLYICKAHEICNKYALDTISAGVVIAFAIECYANGLISKDDTDGLCLSFGDARAAQELLAMICERRGIGNVLAEGVRKAASTIGRGAEQLAMHVKGLEIPMHEPRVKKGLALQYALSPTGADHNEADHDPTYVSYSPVMETMAPLGILEPIEMDDLGPRKVRLFAYLQQLYNVYNYAGICNFMGAPWGPIGIQEVLEAFKGTYGLETSLWELMKSGERGTTMARIYNLACGLSHLDDTLPERFYQAIPDGPSSGAAISRSQLQAAIRYYYGMMGWDKNGIPTPSKVFELEIPDSIADFALKVPWENAV